MCPNSARDSGLVGCSMCALQLRLELHSKTERNSVSTKLSTTMKFCLSQSFTLRAVTCTIAVSSFYGVCANGVCRGTRKIF